MNFNIKEDLEGREFDTQVEILYISGPTYGDRWAIAAVLDVEVAEVNAAIDRLSRKRGTRYDQVRNTKEAAR